MAEVVFRVAEAPAAVMERLREAFAGEENVTLEEDGVRLVGRCAPDEVTSVLDRVAGIAYGCRVEVSFTAGETPPAPPVPSEASPA